MLKKNEFEDWISASHKLYDIFEQRYDAYPLALKWVQQWQSFSKFIIDAKDMDTVERLLQEFDCNAFRNINDRYERDNAYWNKLSSEITAKFGSFVSRNLKIGEANDIGKAISLYLITWNFQRFKEYFKYDRQFDLDAYFSQLGTFLPTKSQKLKSFQAKNLISNSVDQSAVRQVFNEINLKLKQIGKEQNEPVGTAKILHIFAPAYFPLIDNSEAQAIGLVSYGQTLTVDHYISWMTQLKNWLLNYADIIEKLEKQHNYTIVRLVDEGLYLMSSVKQKARVAELGINSGEQ